jgi:hypothetical protein
MKPGSKIKTDTFFMLVGRPAQIYAEHSGQSKNVSAIEVGVTSPENTMSVLGQGVSDVGVISLDGIFCPYTTSTYHASLPHWEVATESGVNNKVLNPFFPDNFFSKVNGTNTAAKMYYESGVSIAAYNSLIDVGVSAQGDLNQYVCLHDYNDISAFVRSVGLRGPLVVTGWGFDTEGNPVPASLTDPTKFASDAFTNSNKWKSGPVDLRWDEGRKVWAASGGSRSVKVRFSIVESDCESCSAIVKILSRTKGEASVPEEYEMQDSNGGFYMETNEFGESVRSKFLTVYDKIGILNESNVNLVNRIGYADYMYGRPKCDYQPWTAWEITALAEQQTECES